VHTSLRSLRENGLSDELLTAHMCHTMDRNYTRCRVMPRRWHKAAGDVWEESGKEIVHTMRTQRHARKERAGVHVVGDESACGWGCQRRCASGGAGKKPCTPPTCPGAEARKGAGWHETGAPSWITGARCAERGETRDNHHAGSERSDAWPQRMCARGRMISAEVYGISPWCRETRVER
jgi:hypothetical protein